MSDIMATSSQSESHFSRKRSYDDIDNTPDLMNVAVRPLSYDGELILKSQTGGSFARLDPLQRGSEDQERFSQEEESAIGASQNGEDSRAGLRNTSSMIDGEQESESSQTGSLACKCWL